MGRKVTVGRFNTEALEGLRKLGADRWVWRCLACEHALAKAAPKVRQYHPIVVCKDGKSAFTTCPGGHVRVFFRSPLSIEMMGEPLLDVLDDIGHGFAVLQPMDFHFVSFRISPSAETSGGKSK